jgi:hypothetical protein
MANKHLGKCWKIGRTFTSQRWKNANSTDHFESYRIWSFFIAIKGNELMIMNYIYIAHFSYGYVQVRFFMRCHSTVPCEQSPLVFLLGTARRSERDSAELVCILCGADNPKTWIIMRNFRFDTGFITGLQPKRKLYLLNLLLGNRQLLSNLRVCSN